MYEPKEKKLDLIFEYMDYDLKKFLDIHKYSLTAY